VRDKYLGRRASDIDIATNATTWEVRRCQRRGAQLQSCSSLCASFSSCCWTANLSKDSALDVLIASKVAAAISIQYACHVWCPLRGVGSRESNPGCSCTILLSQLLALIEADSGFAALRTTCSRPPVIKVSLISIMTCDLTLLPHRS
jgi:hypothetical protein